MNSGILETMGDASWNIPLSATVLQQLQAQGVGEGSFQVLFREIKERVRDGVLQVDERLRDEIGHYAYSFGRGPLQLILRDLLEEIDTVTRTP